MITVLAFWSHRKAKGEGKKKRRREICSDPRIKLKLIFVPNPNQERDTNKKLWCFPMEQESEKYAEGASPHMEADVDLEARDPESNNSLSQPLLKRNRTLSSTPLAIVGTKVSHIESLDYE